MIKKSLIMSFSTTAIGSYAEDLIILSSGFERLDHDNGKYPDLAHGDTKIYMEVKSGLYSRGGVIKGPQLKRFEDYQLSQYIENDNDLDNSYYCFMYRESNPKEIIKYDSIDDYFKIKSAYIIPIQLVRQIYNSKHKKIIKRENPNLENVEYIIFSEYNAKKLYNNNPNNFDRNSDKTIYTFDENIYSKTTFKSELSPLDFEKKIKKLNYFNNLSKSKFYNKIINIYDTLSELDIHLIGYDSSIDKVINSYNQK